MRIDVTRRWLADGATLSFFEDNSVTLEEIPHQQVVFLVGDPGSGKTDTVKTHVLAQPGCRARKLFSEVISSSQVEQWLEEAFQKGEGLFLDAYDERAGQFRRGYLLEPLVRAIAAGSCPLIRIVSRGTHLPESLVEEVRGVLGVDDSASLVYRLQPLTEDQIKYWVSECLGGDSERFFAEIRINQLEPYLGRPVDLQAFINAYKSNGTLGNSPTGAWREAIRFELTETNPDRQDHQTEIALKSDVQDRYRLATVLAISQSLCTPEPILIDGVAESRGTSGITGALLWDQAKQLFPGVDKRLFGDLLRETVQSRLFELGKDGISFASAAKSQFLAAQFLVDGNADQIVNLLKDRLDGTRIPETAQPIASEVAKFVPPLFDWLCSNQPESLLRGVVLDFSPDQRSRLVASLLNRGETRDPHFYGGWNLVSLAHPGLAQQLRPYLRGKVGTGEDLNLAIDIAEYTSCRAVASDLASIALSSTRDLRTRVNSAHALSRIGGRAADLLRPLLQTDRSEDVDDELFACALMGMWPNSFSPDEAFKVLREPQGATGLYHGFLSYSFDGIQHRIDVRHLVPGLRWLATREKKPSGLRDRFDRLAWALVKLAWDNLDLPGVADGLARVAQARERGYSSMVLPFRDKPFLLRSAPELGLDAEDYTSNAENRWKLFRAWLRLPPKGRSSWNVSSFVEITEVEALIKQARSSRGANRTMLVDAVNQIMYALIRNRDNKRLRELQSQLCELGVNLGDLRKKVKVAERKNRRYERPRVRAGFDDSRHHSEILGLLERGNPRDFPRLLGLYRTDQNGWETSNTFQLTRWQRWVDATDPEKIQLRALAIQFLALGPSSERPQGRRKMTNWDWAGLIALLLLCESGPSSQSEHFERARPWLPFLSCRRNDGEIRAHPAFRLFEQLTTTEATNEIHQQIKLSLSDDDNPLNMDRLDELWRVNAGYLLTEESRKWSLKERQRLITILVLQQHPQAEPELQRELRSRSRAKREVAVRLVLTFGFSAAYEDVSKLALRDAETFEQVWDLVWDSPRLDSENRISKLEIGLRVRLFERAALAAPAARDVERRDGSVTTEIGRQRLRDALATSIAADYSQAAFEFVEKWSVQNEYSWLKRVALKARNDYIEGSWKPPELGDVLKLAMDPSKRYVATQRDLHETVCRVLKIVRPVAESQKVYWKNVSARKPADEPAITQNLAELLSPHLKNMIVNAEVSCLHGRSDIQVEAIERTALDEPKRLKCVIEAKHCHNRDLESAIESQLVGTYLQRQLGQTGVYLVFWSCPRKKCRCSSRAALMRALQEQADKAASPVSVIHFEMKAGEPRKERSRGQRGRSDIKKRPRTVKDSN